MNKTKILSLLMAQNISHRFPEYLQIYYELEEDWQKSSMSIFLHDRALDLERILIDCCSEAVEEGFSMLVAIDRFIEQETEYELEKVRHSFESIQGIIDRSLINEDRNKKLI